MTLENQTLHLEVERLEVENAGLRLVNAQLEEALRRAKAERDQYKADYERSHRRCNRMACSADLKDVQWRPA